MRTQVLFVPVLFCFAVCYVACSGSDTGGEPTTCTLASVKLGNDECTMCGASACCSEANACAQDPACQQCTSQGLAGCQDPKAATLKDCLKAHCAVACPMPACDAPLSAPSKGACIMLTA